MKLYIQEKLFTLKDKFNVKDELGADKYFIEGEFLSLGHKLHIQAMDGKELALIQEKILTFLPKFFILMNGNQVAEIVQKFTLFKPKYVVNGLNWTIAGDFLQHDYSILKDGKIIASIHKKWLSWGDCFEIDTQNDVDPVMVLAVVLAIDCVLDAQERRRS